MDITIEKYLELLLNKSSDIIITITPNFIIKGLNKKAEKYFAIDDHSIERNIFELFASKGLQTPIDAYYKNERLEKRIAYTNLYGENGKYILSWDVEPIFNPDQTISFIVLLAVVDEYNDFCSITNKNLVQFINCTPGSLYWKDKEGKYLGCNNFMVETSGLTNIRDIIGKTDFDLWPKENAEQLHKNDQYVTTSGKTIITNEIITITNGETKYFTGVKMPLLDSNNNIIGVIGNSLDITELEKAKKTLEIAMKKIETANKTKTEFLCNMRHDFRTPFTGILGMAKLLYSDETDNNKKEQIECIIKSANGLLEQLDEILEFVSLEDGVLAVSERQFDLTKVIEDIQNLILPAVKEKKLKLNIHLDNNVPKYLIGDSTRTQRILMNLLNNAVKFTNYGHITFKTSVGKQQDNNIVLKFVVEDTGVGISDLEKEFIFEKFSRLTPSYKGIYQGNGLGLRIVKQFLNEIGGEIHVKSKLGEGSTFVVVVSYKLPLLNSDEKDLLIEDPTDENRLIA
jgi:PAS domain S-box-containing protein